MKSIDGLTEIVRTSPDAASGWTRLVDFCRDEHPGPLWSELPAIDPARDVSTAWKWLKDQMHRGAAPKPARGVYLGLDTLNMEGGDAYNVEIGATKNCDPSKLETDWAYNCEWYGDRHLIAGLRDLKRVYEAPRYGEASAFADYALFLGYSGLVLANAIERLAGTSPFLAAWGFHDGDLFFLGRRDAGGFERICKVF